MSSIDMRRKQDEALRAGNLDALAENRYGEAEIAENILETIPNPHPGPNDPYCIYWKFPEFTCKCPRSGYPDFATVHFWWLPAASIIELKTVKLWLNSYRDRYAFHEAVANELLDTLVEVAEPLWARLRMDFSPRGNLTTVITRIHRSRTLPGWIDYGTLADVAAMAQ